MSLGILAFVAGVTWVQHWSRLPIGLEWFLLIGMVLLLAVFRLWIAWAMLLGVLWASVYGDWRLSETLAVNLQGQDIKLQGYILSLPEHQDNRLSFDFVVTKAQPGIPVKLHLNWYNPKVELRAGQAWEMSVRLKRPHGRSNPGGFDYEAWLFANHVGATGYVRTNSEPQPLSTAFNLQRTIAVCRQAISDHLDKALPDSKQLGVIKALTIGSQDLISQQQWALFRQTGIVHLMVISGSHISLIAGLVFLLVRRFWIRWGSLQISPQNVAALLAWFAALFYAGLSGFSIPTQRAMLMLSVALWAIVRQRHTAAMPILALALLVVVLVDPLAVISAGFWLSFVAVALLIFISSGRLGHTTYWREAFKLHFAMAVGLAPLLIVFFQQVSLIAPFANWLAVPLVGFLVTPLALLGTATALLSDKLAGWLLWPVDGLLQVQEWFLQQMALWPAINLNCSQPPWYSLLLAVVGIMLLLAPRGIPGRYLSPFLLLPVLFVQVDKPKAGEIWLTLLDVGQGLATVVQTEHHTLVFDTGAKYSEQSDMGESVLLPFLRYQNINALDKLMISHGDIDHSGGAASLLAALPIDGVYSSVAPWAEHDHGQYCQAGQGWIWDGVEFTVLAPMAGQTESENDRSCVLKITGVKQSFLLTGDIEADAENLLVERYGETLRSTVLIAPHHGSKTSSSYPFLQQVRPAWVLIPAGYLNRFGFPHAQVMQRYQRMNTQTLITGLHGAISVKVSDSGLELETSRQTRHRYWMLDTNK